MDDKTWANRPCARRWTVHQRPCAWFKAGGSCQKTWGDLISPWQYVVIFLAEVNLMLAAGVIIDGVVRKRAYRGTPFGASYMRLVYFVVIGFCALGVASLDLNGGNRFLTVEWRLGLQAAIRVLMEMALFEVGDSYKHALRKVMVSATPAGGLPETARVVLRSVLAALFSGSIATWEVKAVPRGQREGCLLSIANTIRNVGTASIDLTFFVHTFRYVPRATRTPSCLLRRRCARAARRAVSDRLRRQPFSESLAADYHAADMITTHIFALCCCMAAVFSFALIASIRNTAAGKFLCEQPSCTLRTYPSRILWAFWYHVGVWVIVLAMVPNRIATRIGNTVSLCATMAKREQPRAWSIIWNPTKPHRQEQDEQKDGCTTEIALQRIELPRCHPTSITGKVEDGMVEDGIVEDGMVEDGIVEAGMVEAGMVEDGRVEESMVEGGMVEAQAAETDREAHRSRSTCVLD